jgi:uncharacterized SAM-dependent methyltransferase
VLKFFNSEVLGLSKTPKEPLRRFEIGVDFNSFPIAQFVAGGYVFVPEDLPRQVIETGVVDEAFWYCDERGTADYLAILQSPYYVVLKQTKKVLDASWSSVFDEVQECVGASPLEPKPLDFVALGVGSADKELGILKSWLDTYTSPNIRKAIEYIPVDISPVMLLHSFSAVVSDKLLRERIRHHKLQVKPMLADFRQLTAADLGDLPVKVFAMLGGVWNWDVKNVFGSLRKVMSTLEQIGNKCFLLVDAEFIGNRSDAELKTPYEKEKMVTSFLFHPIEMLHAAARDKSAVMQYKEGEPANHDVEFAKFFADYTLTRKRGKVHVDLISSKNLDKFIDDFDFDGVTVKQYLLGGGGLEKSRTVVIYYVPNKWKKRKGWPRPILLGYSTKFDSKEFVNLMNAEGFEIIGRPDYDSSGQFGIFLLQLATNEQKVTQEIQTDLHEMLSRLSTKEKFKIKYNKKTDHVEFDAVLEFQRSRLPAGPLAPLPTVLIRTLKTSEGVADLNKEVGQLSKDCESALSTFGSIKGAILWLPPDTARPDTLKSLEEKYQNKENRVKLKIVEKEKEFKDALRFFGL